MAAKDAHSGNHPTVADIVRFEADAAWAIVLDDRRRIAEDFHDRVIQRIFAANLMLHNLRARIGAGEIVAMDLERQLDEVMRELDQATREARASIYTLTETPNASNAESAVHETVTLAGVILAAPPRLTVEGDLDTVDLELVSELATVAREALTNVAKHAEATSVDVTVTIDDTRATLVVADDGVGMPGEPSRSSGTANLSRRAERRGGSASWAPNAPSGTVFTWDVPRELVPGQAPS